MCVTLCDPVSKTLQESALIACIRTIYFLNFSFTEYDFEKLKRVGNTMKVIQKKLSTK